MPRGGRRAGKPGTPYPNRSDLSGAPPAAPLPATAAPGQPYGQAAQQVAAQLAVPMAPAPPMPVTPSPSPAPSPSAPGPPAPPQPGSFGAFDRPSERPNEPVTAGLPVGPGPGPEALGAPSQTPQTTADLLSRLAYRSPEISALLAKAQAGNG